MMNDQLSRCIEEGKVEKVDIDTENISNELGHAHYDLEASELSASEGIFKWAVIQGHFSIEHSFRALLLTKGYKSKNKSEICLVSGIKTLFIDSGVLDEHFLKDFEYSMKVLQGEAHGYADKEDFALYIINCAGEVYEIAKKITDIAE